MMSCTIGSQTPDYKMVLCMLLHFASGLATVVRQELQAGRQTGKQADKQAGRQASKHSKVQVSVINYIQLPVAKYYLVFNAVLMLDGLTLFCKCDTHHVRCFYVDFLKVKFLNSTDHFRGLLTQYYNIT